MAIRIPDEPKEQAPYSERLVYKRLGDELPEDAVVLHSLGLVKHRRKIWGEADIMILSRYGFFALEVKGGSVACTDGVWHFGDPARGGYTKKEDPWTQAKDAMFACKEFLEGKDASLGSVLFGYGVVMPMETFTTTGCEIEPGVLLDKRYFSRNMNEYIRRLRDHWVEEYRTRHGRPPPLPTHEQIRAARKLLRPNVESAFSIGTYLNGIDEQLLELTNGQIRASRRIADNPRTIVRGKAGTGKTVVALDRAKRLAAEGQNVLFLCFNRLLARHMTMSLGGPEAIPGLEVRHIHSLFRDFIETAGLQGQLDVSGISEERLFGEVFPRVFVEAVLTTEPPQWDAIVVDEAQDLLTPDNLDALDLILKGGIERGRWHLFMDPLQNIYREELTEVVQKRLTATFPVYDTLPENCRNTRQVAVQASIISGIDLETFGAPEGPPCENIYYRSPAHFREELEGSVARLVRGHTPPHQIAILSTKRREKSLVAGMEMIAGKRLVDLSSETPGPDDLVFSTMHAFKGLERQVVLAIDMDGIGDPDLARLHYVGLSRACGLLRCFLPGSAKGAYGRQAAAFADRMGDIP